MLILNIYNKYKIKFSNLTAVIFKIIKLFLNNKKENWHVIDHLHKTIPNRGNCISQPNARGITICYTILFKYTQASHVKI